MLRKTSFVVDTMLIVQQKITNDRLKILSSELNKILQKNYEVKTEIIEENSFECEKNYKTEKCIVVNFQSRSVIKFIVYLRIESEVFLQKFDFCMKYFSKKRMDLNQIIAITLAKEWRYSEIHFRRNMKLFSLRAEIIELSIANMKGKIAGQIVNLYNFSCCNFIPNCHAFLKKK
jgi:hypothetical protein